MNQGQSFSTILFAFCSQYVGEDNGVAAFATPLPSDEDDNDEFGVREITASDEGACGGGTISIAGVGIGAGIALESACDIYSLGKSVLIGAALNLGTVSGAKRHDICCPLVTALLVL